MINEFIAKAENKAILAVLGIKYADEPIVRCRDCKYYQFDDMYGSMCVHVHNGKYEQWEVEPDGFCKWGERKWA